MTPHRSSHWITCPFQIVRHRLSLPLSASVPSATPVWRVGLLGELWPRESEGGSREVSGQWVSSCTPAGTFDRRWSWCLWLEEVTGCPTLLLGLVSWGDGISPLRAGTEESTLAYKRASQHTVATTVLKGSKTSTSLLHWTLLERHGSRNNEDTVLFLGRAYSHGVWHVPYLAGYFFKAQGLSMDV